MGISPAIILAVSVPLAVVAVDIVRRLVQYHTERKRYPLPPGPTPLPLLGNVLSIDPHLPWVTYTKWKAKYGDIIHVRLLGTDVVVLNSVSVAIDLLDRRSKIYSDRPYIPTAFPYGHDCNFSLAPYGDHWRLCRRIFQQTFRANAALRFRPIQLRSARRLVCNLIDDPETYPSHFQTFSTAVALSAVYDYEPGFRSDPMVSIVEGFLRTAMPGLAPGNVLLATFFPFLLCMPEWCPGAWMRREAKEACAWRDQMVETPYRYAKTCMTSKEGAHTAMVADHLTRMEKLGGAYHAVYEHALKTAAATAFLGSAETTSSTLMTFTLAMVENPHVWKRAQSSIDAVIGTDRLPEFDDRPALAYVEAVVRETMRWRPVVPVIPHAVTSSDIYEGYYIPKGAIILGNVWAMSHDETRYPDANEFRPQRFLDKEGKLTDDDPGEFAFGFGRRKCPGRYTADASVWSAIATMLATLDFDLAKDADGNEITFEATFTSGATEHPNYFPCHLTPRTHVGKEMIARVLAN